VLPLDVGGGEGITVEGEVVPDADAPVELVDVDPDADTVTIPEELMLTGVKLAARACNWEIMVTCVASLVASLASCRASSLSSLASCRAIWTSIRCSWTPATAPAAAADNTIRSSRASRVKLAGRRFRRRVFNMAVSPLKVRAAERPSPCVVAGTRAQPDPAGDIREVDPLMVSGSVTVQNRRREAG
jgi:hypothetical protein